MLNLALKSATLICPLDWYAEFVDAYNCFFDDLLWSLWITRLTREVWGADQTRTA